MSDSLDLRKKVIDYRENGGSITKAAALFNIGRATIYRWRSQGKTRSNKGKTPSEKAELESTVKRCPRKSRGKIKQGNRTSFCIKYNRQMLLNVTSSPANWQELISEEVTSFISQQLSIAKGFGLLVLNPKEEREAKLLRNSIYALLPPHLPIHNS